jgi:hypothetical protein
VNRYPSFHSIDLGNGIVTPCRKSPEDHAKEAAVFLDPIKTDGATAIDIGAWNRFHSFEAKRQGAKRVLTADSFAWHHETLEQEAFELALSALGLDVEMLDVDVPNLSIRKIGGCSMWLYLLGFYHLVDPHQRRPCYTKKVYND